MSFRSNLEYKEVFKMNEIRYCNDKVEINSNRIYQEDNFKKIYDLVIVELRNLMKYLENNEEHLWELNCIKEEIEEVRNEINEEFLGNLIYSNYINSKYKELYKKIDNNVKNIKNKNEYERNMIMFDFLSEVFTSIYDYTKIIFNEFIRKERKKKINKVNKVKILEKKSHLSTNNRSYYDIAA